MCSNPVANARNTTAIRLRRICHGCSIPLLSHGKSYLLGWRASSDISGRRGFAAVASFFCRGFEGAPAACLLPGLSLASALLRAPVAQLDRASDYGSEGLGFESLRARHFSSRGLDRSSSGKHRARIVRSRDLSDNPGQARGPQGQTGAFTTWRLSSTTRTKREREAREATTWACQTDGH